MTIYSNYNFDITRRQTIKDTINNVIGNIEFFNPIPSNHCEQDLESLDLFLYYYNFFHIDDTLTNNTLYERTTFCLEKT